MTPVWDRIGAEYDDTLQAARVQTHYRNCAQCGKPCRTTSGLCMDCQPSLLEPVSTPYSRGETAQLGPDDPWPPEMF